MVGFLVGWWRARAARPLLWWVVALALYVLLPLPESWVLFLIMGLGVALTVTVRRLREGSRTTDRAERMLSIADRLTGAIEDRIRYTTPSAQAQSSYGSVYADPARPQLPVGPVYDPGALLSAIAAVLAAEGIPTNAAPALPACAQLLTWQGIGIVPGAPAPTVHALVTGLAPGAPRCCRVVPPGVFATCVAAVLISDGVLPTGLTSTQAEALLEASAVILGALNITPDINPESPAHWPVMADIINTAPRP